MFQPDTRRVIIVSEKSIAEDHAILYRLKDEGYLPLTKELTAKLGAMIGLDKPAVLKEKSTLLQEIRQALDEKKSVSKRPVVRRGKKS